MNNCPAELVYIKRKDHVLCCKLQPVRKAIVVPYPPTTQASLRQFLLGLKQNSFFSQKLVSLWGHRVAHPIRKLRIGRKGQVDDNF
jgi:hypothetical protein